MTTKFNILITSAGRRVELVKAFQDALKFHFPKALVFAADFIPQLSAACRVSDGSFSSPRATAPEYVQFLRELCISKEIGMIIPTIDTELHILAKHRQLFFDAGIEVVISDLELVSNCRDKRKTAEVFSMLKIDHPVIFDRKTLKFPCFCKPYDGSRSIGAKIIMNPDMLTPDVLSNQKNIFMELIDSEYKEYTIDAYYSRDSRLCCIVPRERLEVRSGEVSKGVTRKDYVYDYLLSKLGNLDGGRGCITIQAFYNSLTRDIKAIEINARFGGGYPLSHAAGANYPDWMIREYFKREAIDFYDSWEPNLMMLRYDAKVIVHENDRC